MTIDREQARSLHVMIDTDANRFASERMNLHGFTSIVKNSFGPRFKEVYTPAQRNEVFDHYYEAYREANLEAGYRLANFEAKADDCFDQPWQREVVGKALKIATVAHQYNNSVKDRFRKSDGSPYIFHPVVMADFLLDDGWDVLTVAAALLHDVPEDSNLGPFLNTPEQWLVFIREEFNTIVDPETNEPIGVGFDNNQNIGDLLSEIIDAKTKRPLPQDPGVVDRVRGNPLSKVVMKFLEQEGPERGYMERREAADEVTFNLYNLFDKSLASPDHWRALSIFIVDTWHNMQTASEVKPEKLLRGRVAMGLAESMGWFRMRSALAESLAQGIDLNKPFRPAIGYKDTPGQAEFSYLQKIRSYKDTILDKYKNVYHIPHFESSDIVLGWSAGREAKRSSWRETTIPKPGFDFNVPRASLRELMERMRERGSFYTHHRSLDGTIAQSSSHYKRKQYLNTILVNSVLGRLTMHHDVLIGNKDAFQVRLHSNEPYLTDLFNRNNSFKPEDSPESHLFNPFLRNTIHWEHHLSVIIPYFYDPQVAAQDVTMRCVVWKRNMLFFDGDTRFNEVFWLLGFNDRSNFPDIRTHWGANLEYKPIQRLKRLPSSKTVERLEYKLYYIEDRQDELEI